MESLSSVGTIVRMVQDIAGAVATASRNRSRCRKLAKRVQGIGDLLRELESSEAAEAGSSPSSTDAATRRLLGRLEEALRRALQLVRSCQDSGCPQRLVAGGRQAGRFDEVNEDIDQCLLDLGISNRILLEKLLRDNAAHFRDPSTEETVTVRIGMPCDDSTDHIKRNIHQMKGVIDVAAAASTKDQFKVTIRSGAVDIPSLLDQVKDKLNRHVELVTPASPRKDTGGSGGAGVLRDDVKKYNHNKHGAAEDGGDKQKHHRYASSGDEIKKEKAAAMAAAVKTGMNQAPAPIAYLPFRVALVPIDEASMHPAPASPYNFLPYPHPQGPPGNAQPYLHRARAPAKKFIDGGGDTKGTVKDGGDKDDYNKGSKFTTGDSGADKKKDPEFTGGGGERQDVVREKTAAADNATAIGVPVNQSPGTGGHYHDNAAAYHCHQHSPYPYMFSDENPNACSIM